MAKMTESEPNHSSIQPPTATQPLIPDTESVVEIPENHSGPAVMEARYPMVTEVEHQPRAIESSEEPAVVISQFGPEGELVTQDDATSPPEPPKTPSGQLPKWVIGVVVAVMVLLPLGLFLLTRSEEEKPVANDNSAEPTRTSLLSPSPAPTNKITPSPFPTDEVTPTPAGSPTPKLSPTVVATGLSNLSVDEVYFEDAQNGQRLDTLYAGQHINLRTKLRNTGTVDARNFISYWKMQGNLVGRNEHGTVRANSEAVYDDVNSLTYSGVTTKEGELVVSYFADPDNSLKEANTNDNSKSKTVTVGATRTDLEAADIEFYHPQTGEKMTMPVVGQAVLIKPVVKNLGQDKQIDYEIKWYINGSEVKKAVSKTWILPGESKVIGDNYQHTFAAGSTEVKIEVNQDKAIPETNSGNNTKIKSVPL